MILNHECDQIHAILRFPRCTLAYWQEFNSTSVHINDPWQLLYKKPLILHVISAQMVFNHKLEPNAPNCEISKMNQHEFNVPLLTRASLWKSYPRIPHYKCPIGYQPRFASCNQTNPIGRYKKQTSARWHEFISTTEHAMAHESFSFENPLIPHSKCLNDSQASVMKWNRTYPAVRFRSRRIWAAKWHEFNSINTDRTCSHVWPISKSFSI